MFRRARRGWPRLPAPHPEIVAQQAADLPQPATAAAVAQTSASAETVPGTMAESGAVESMRCVFGAVRVGPLLGRLRLHLQTEHFLAVHRGDAEWQDACAGASLALNEIVTGFTEAEFNAPLAPHGPQGVAVRTDCRCCAPCADRNDEGCPVAATQAHSRTADSSSPAKGGLLGMTIPGSRSAVSATTPGMGAR
jgi:hypothetical protein